MTSEMVVHSARKEQAILEINGKVVGSADYETALRIRDLWNGQIALLGSTSSDTIIQELVKLAKHHRANGSRKMHLYAEGAAARITTLTAQLAERDAEIEALREEVARLRDELRAPLESTDQ